MAPLSLLAQSRIRFEVVQNHFLHLRYSSPPNQPTPKLPNNSHPFPSLPLPSSFSNFSTTESQTPPSRQQCMDRIIMCNCLIANNAKSTARGRRRQRKSAGTYLHFISNTLTFVDIWPVGSGLTSSFTHNLTWFTPLLPGWTNKGAILATQLFMGDHGKR